MEDITHIISIISILATIGLAIYAVNTNTQLEILRGQVSRQNFIHQLQFEKEFEIYKELWSLISDLGNYTAQLRPTMDYAVEGKSYEAIINDRVQKISESRNEFVKMFQKNKPFYSDAIYYKLLEFNSIIRKEVFSAKHDDSLKRKYWEEAEENVKKIQEITDEICLLIRERITLSK